jgi:hypothetical protein
VHLRISSPHRKTNLNYLTEQKQEDIKKRKIFRFIIEFVDCPKAAVPCDANIQRWLHSLMQRSVATVRATS